MTTTRLCTLYRRYLQAPDHPAKLRIIRFLERRLFPSQGLPFPVTSDMSLYLHPREATQYSLLQGVPYEPLTEAFIRRNLKAGDTFAVSGASFGHYVVMASKIVGPTGSVLAVEPQPGSMKQTRMNLLLNECPKNVTLFSGALGESRAVVQIGAAPEETLGWSSIVTRDRGDFPFSVCVSTLGEVLQATGLPCPDLMILDVEGYEPYVLRGLSGGDYRPKVLIVEAHPIVLNITGTSQGDLLAMIRQLGYSLFTLRGESSLPDRLPEDNIIAVHTGVKVRW